MVCFATVGISTPGATSYGYFKDAMDARTSRVVHAPSERGFQPRTSRHVTTLHDTCPDVGCVPLGLKKRMEPRRYSCEGPRRVSRSESGDDEVSVSSSG